MFAIMRPSTCRDIASSPLPHRAKSMSSSKYPLVTPPSIAQRIVSVRANADVPDVLSRGGTKEDVLLINALG